MFGGLFGLCERPNVSQNVRRDREDRGSARDLVLSMLAGGQSVDEMASAMAGLHPRGDLFPGDVLIVMAAGALAESGASRHHPLDGSTLYERFLAE